MPLLELRILELHRFPHFSPTCFWHILLRFCICPYFHEPKIKFECCQFALIFVGVMPLFELGIFAMHSFPYFSPSCFDILSWNLVYDFHLFTSDQVWVLLFCVNFCMSYAPFRTWIIVNIRTFLLHTLTYRAEILHMTFFFKLRCPHQVWVSPLRIFFSHPPVKPEGTLGLHSVCPPVSLSVCSSHSFSGLFFAMLSHIWMKVGSKLLYEELQIKFDFLHGWHTFSWVIALCSKFVFRTFLHSAFTYLNEIW